MRLGGFGPFLKKEIGESLRTFKFLILALVMVAFGILSPLMIKYLPLLFETAFSGETYTGGMDLVALLPPVTALMSWTEFFANLAQTGVIALVIVFSGTLSGEAGKGTLLPLLARGLSRYSVVLAKMLNIALIWTGSYFLSYGLTYGLTVILFPNEPVAHLLPVLLYLWLYGLFMAAATLFASALCKNMVASLLTVLGVWVLTLGLSIVVPVAYRYNPLTLSSCAGAVLGGATPYGDLLPAVWITLALTAALTTAAALVFRRRQL